MKINHKQLQAFTIVELLIVVVLITILALIRFPALAGTKANVQRINCSNNLKQVGIAFRTWAGNHQERMPMSITRANGGAAEAVGFASTVSWAGGGIPTASQVGVWWMFMVMSNDLVTPKILFCPSDSAPSHNGSGAFHIQATVFAPKTASVEGFQNDYNVSYFVGVDANSTLPDMFLTGDHNLGTGVNQSIKTPQFISAGTNANWATTAIGWQNNNHSKQGNVCMTDGSVQNLTTPLLREALNKANDTPRNSGVFNLATGSTGTGINRLQFP